MNIGDMLDRTAISLRVNAGNKRKAMAVIAVADAGRAGVGYGVAGDAGEAEAEDSVFVADHMVSHGNARVPKSGPARVRAAAGYCR